jgi:cytochrome c oxidase subunit I+III
MLADFTAFISVVFGYFFFWTVHDDFPPAGAPGPGVVWPSLGLALVLGAWLLTLLARRLNRSGAAWTFYAALGTAVVLAAAGVPALLAGPWLSGLDPTSHSHGATVWLLLCWTALHVALGVIMHVYCVARRIAGRMTAAHDMDLHNVVLYWHFTALTALLTVAVVAGFPLVA